MKPLTLFLPDLAIDTHLAPQILQLQQIRNAAIEFCEKTKCWIDVQTYPLALGEVIYEFDLQAGQVVHEIRDGHLVMGGLAPPVIARSPAWCNEYYPGWQDGSRLGQPSNVTSLDPATFIPVPAAIQNFDLVLTLALKPSRDATLVPDILYNDHYDAIVAGAKGRLMAIPGKAWSNAQLAVAYGSQFDELAMVALRRVEKGFGRARHRVKGSYL